MNKNEFIGAIAAKTGTTKKDTAVYVQAVTDVISEALKAGDKIQLVGFGTFETVEKAERTGRNPRTGEDLIIPARKSPKFKAGKALKDFINE